MIQARLHGETPPAFSYFNKGNLAVIGRNAGVADFGRFHLSGRLAWLAWLFIHLAYLAQALNRVLVFLRWGYQYLTYYRGSRLITGETGKK